MRAVPGGDATLRRIQPPWQRLRGAALAFACWLTGSLALPAGAVHVNAIQIDGSVNPISSTHIQEVIERSEAEGAAAVLIELDTPGGLVASTKDIIQAMLNAEVPVIVFVSPRGAWAASAGTFITLAGHVAAMAPGTTIGAASPIGIGGEGGDRGEEDERRDVSLEKSEQVLMAYIESIAKERGRNVEWAVSAVRKAEAITADKALELGVIDLIASDRADLLRQIEGREVSVASGKRVLEVASAEVRTIEMDTVTRLFNFLASPDIAFILGMAGLLGLYIEFNNPGLILPGVAGAICLVLAGIALQILPYSAVGLLLLALGMALMVAEVFLSTFGVLFALGIACFLLGGSMVFDMPEVNDLTVSFWPVVVPVALGFAIFGGLVVFAVGRANFRRQTAGVGELIGLMGRVTTPLAPEGKVFVRGEYWTAHCDGEIAEGEAVEVVGVDGLLLQVKHFTTDE